MCISYTELTRNHQVWNNENDFLFNILMLQCHNVTMLRKPLEIIELRGDITYAITVTTVTFVTVVTVSMNVMSRFKSLIISSMRHNVTL